VTKADIDAQKAAVNVTIQHTVSDITGGVPERVAEIVFEEEEEEEGGKVRHHKGLVALAAAPIQSVRLMYKITVFDPQQRVETLRARLIQAARDGQMDAGLRYYATRFGASVLYNASLSSPQVSNAAVQRGSTSQLTGVMIILLVIGVTMALVLLTVVAVMFKKEALSADGLGVVV